MGSCFQDDKKKKIRGEIVVKIKIGKIKNKIINKIIMIIADVNNFGVHYKYLQNVLQEVLIHERNHSCRRLGHKTLPAYYGNFQAASSRI